MHPLAILASLGAITAWGSAAIFDKIAMAHFKSAWVAVTIRMGLAWAIVAGISFASGGLREAVSVPRYAIIALLVSGLLGSLIGQVSYYAAVKYAEVSRVVGITSAYPLVTFLLGTLLLRESVTPVKLAGVLLSVAGITLLTLPSK